LIMSQVL